MTMKQQKVRLTSMRLATLGLVVSAVLPLPSRAQAPVFEITPVESTTHTPVDCKFHAEYPDAP